MIYTYNEAYNDSLGYFNGDELAAKVFVDKYALRDKQENILENTPELMHKRLAKEFARIEAKKFKIPLTEEEIFNLFDKFKYIVPQGSPMFGIGNDFQICSISNCYVLESPEDSYSGILEIDAQLVNISKRRGGVGISLDKLRPKDTPTTNAAKSSTGIVSWMERYSNSIREVGQHGRRGALMLTLSVHHPDIVDFATVKNDPSKVTGANISVKLSKEFLDAVKNNTEYEQRWESADGKIKISKMVSAKSVWDIIIHSAWLRAEPGLLMWDNILEEGVADLYEEYRSICTNPCSEISLSALDSCRLLCLNLFSYVVNPFTKSAYFNYELFFNHSKLAQRLMDNLVDLESEKIDKIIAKIESDPEPVSVKAKELDMWRKIQKFNNEGRRTGLGITALGDTLAALNIYYGSDESIATTGYIYNTLKLGAYSESVEMAKELGPFKIWNTETEKNSKFLNRFKDEELNLIPRVFELGQLIAFEQQFVSGKTIYEDMQKYGRRNIALITTAPTGSVSCLTQTSSGIEPVFMLGYTRRKKVNPNDKNVKIDFVDDKGDSWQEFTVYHPKVKLWMEITGETDIRKSPWYGCCAEEIDWIQRVKLQAAAQKHVCHAISSTINLPADIEESKIAEIYTSSFEMGLKGITVYRNGCRSGVLVETSNTTKTDKIEKRPKVLKCDIHNISVSKNKYTVIVGLHNDKPYEVFCVSDYIDKHKHGEIIKNGKGDYIVKTEEYEYSLKNYLEDDTQNSLLRLISTCLRHGADMKFVVEQLQKTKGDLMSFNKCIARALKKYITDGDSSSEKCSCGSLLVYQEGCLTCKNCGYSKCN